MEIIDTGGKRRQRVIDYFMGLENLMSVADEDSHVVVFQYEGCKVEVYEEIINHLRNIEVPRVKVIFDGEPVVQQRMIDVFRLHFLSAGG